MSKSKNNNEYNEMLRRKRKDDKFIPGTIESDFDNYLSVEEEVDEKEAQEKDIEETLEY